jgi:nitroreductase
MPAAPLLELTAEDLLVTTRAVRKRLDFDRPVDRDTLRACVEVALQAPSGSNRWPMQFLVVTDRALVAAAGAVYARAYADYKAMDGVYIGSIDKGTPALNDQQQRTARSADHLAENMGRAPALVLACATGRADGDVPPIRKTTLLGSVLPGMWSFMLAARLRGLGTSWTTVALFRERELAEVLGIPIDSVTIGAMTPVAYTLGTDFKPAARPAADDVIHWDRW